MEDKGIIERIARRLAAGDPVGALVHGLPPTDLQSLMLHVYRERSRDRDPGDLVAQYERNAMLRPAAGDARALAALEYAALECAEQFEAVDLSPVAPLGVNAVLGMIDQNNCLATVRNAEVLADPTASQALECARRRRAGATGPIRLCARSRPLRLQPLGSPDHSPHFAMYSLVTAGRALPDMAFETASLREHLGVHLALLRRLAGAGYRFGGMDIAVSDTARDESRLARARDEVLAPLAQEYPEATLRIDLAREHGRNYYGGLCLRIDVVDASGERVNLGDGGFCDWTARLLSNARERLLCSALGLEMILRRLR